MPEQRKPTNAELDGWGMSHIGRVRSLNQDTFVLATLRKNLVVAATNLPASSFPEDVDDRIATLGAVADGIGSGVGGEEASRVAVEHMMKYVAFARHCYETHDPDGEEFAEALQRAAVACHAELLGRRHADPGLTGLATTLTLLLGVWPWVYLLQVGDSRYYLFRDGVLTQVTRDQTHAQELVDLGVLSRSEAHRSMLANILSSAVGGQQIAPVVTRVRSDWRNTHLLCSDGLTKHVPDEKIAERLRTMTSAKQCCEQLVQDALDDGGTDNVTVLIGRAVPRSGAPGRAR